MHRLVYNTAAAAALICALAIVARAENSPDFSDEGALFNPPGETVVAPDFSAAPRLAMVIPAAAEGLVGRAARRFRDGFVHAAEVDGVAVRLDTYRTDGAPDQARAAWQAAVARGAALIIGPMTKDEVAALADAPVAVPTIVLQPARAKPGEPLFILTLDAGEEARQLARAVAAHGFVRAIVVTENSDYGRRVERGFAAEWDRQNRRRAESRRIFGENGLVDLFNELKEEQEEDPQTAIVIAGRGDFARRTRAHLPARFVAYATTPARGGAARPGARRDFFLDGVRFLEMPWLAAPDGEIPARYDDENVRLLPLAEQRFFALGIDAFRVARAAAEWLPSTGDWRQSGVSGEIRLEDDNHFRRRGLTVVHRDGKLVLLGEPRRE